MIDPPNEKVVLGKRKRGTFDCVGSPGDDPSDETILDREELSEG